MSEDKRTLLEEVNTAIETVLSGGQSYRIGARSLTRADLAMLKALRDDLQAQTADEGSGPFLGRTYAAFFDGR